MSNKIGLFYISSLLYQSFNVAWGKIIAGSATHTKHSNELSGHNLELFDFKIGGTYSNVHSFIRSAVCFTIGP